MIESLFSVSTVLAVTYSIAIRLIMLVSSRAGSLKECLTVSSGYTVSSSAIISEVDLVGEFSHVYRVLGT